MNYDWREDVIDVSEDSRWDDDYRNQIYYRAGELIVEENGRDYYDDPEDGIYEEMSNIITLDAIPLDSGLYSVLCDWYANQGKNIEDEVRNYFTDDAYMYFVGGMNYDVFDADLLGGSGNGETKAAFETFWREA